MKKHILQKHLNKLLGKTGPCNSIFWLSRKDPKISIFKEIQIIQMQTLLFIAIAKTKLCIKHKHLNKQLGKIGPGIPIFVSAKKEPKTPTFKESQII